MWVSYEIEIGDQVRTKWGNEEGKNTSKRTQDSWKKNVKRLFFSLVLTLALLINVLKHLKPCYLWSSSLKYIEFRTGQEIKLVFHYILDGWLDGILFSYQNILLCKLNTLYLLVSHKKINNFSCHIWSVMKLWEEQF